MNRMVVLARSASFRAGTAGCSRRREQVHRRAEAAMICSATKAYEKIQWMQKAKIAVIYIQDIMLNDNTVRLFHFAHSSHTTPSPVAFQTVLVYCLAGESLVGKH